MNRNARALSLMFRSPEFVAALETAGFDFEALNIQLNKLAGVAITIQTRSIVTDETSGVAVYAFNEIPSDLDVPTLQKLAGVDVVSIRRIELGAKVAK